MLRSKFPVGECIEECTLTDLGAFKSDKDTIIFFVFKKGSSLLTVREYNPRMSVLGTEKYQEERLRINKFLESIFLIYLEPSEIVQISKRSKDLIDYLENIKTTIKDRGGFEVLVDLKTIPDKNGNAKLPKYISYGNKFFPFIRRSDDTLKELIYSKSEKKLWDLNSEKVVAKTT